MLIYLIQKALKAIMCFYLRYKPIIASSTIMLTEFLYLTGYDNVSKSKTASSSKFTLGSVKILFFDQVLINQKENSNLKTKV